MYGDMEGVDRNEEKSWHYLVLAAKSGSVKARYGLGAIEHSRGNDTLAYKHWRISAAVGCDESLQFIRRGYNEGRVTEDEYGKALRDHQKAKDGMQNGERDLYSTLRREMERKQDDTCTA